MININRNVNDDFYRYKMPKVILVYESNKTLIKNIENISKSLHRDPNHIIKFISSNLGCTSFKNNENFYLNGNFDEKRLQQQIYDFIDLFLLCSNCNNPETKFIIEDDLLKKSCQSCGSNILQENNKLNSLIIKEIDNKKFIDKNYDKKILLSEFIDEKNINNLYDVFINNNLDIDDVFIELIDYKSIKYYKKIFDQFDKSLILEKIENMIEKNERSHKTKSYLKNLIKNGFKLEEIENYFNKQKKNKKRNNLIKKLVKEFLEENDE